MNIAEQITAYYDTQEYQNNWSIYLLEDGDAVQDRIKNICQTYEFEQMYGHILNLNSEPEIVEQIYLYILENIEEFTTTFNSYYVGYSSIDSITFGEEEENLKELINPRTEKPYSLQYLKNIFNEVGWMINGHMAYLDMTSGGVHVDMLLEEIPMIKELIQKAITGDNNIKVTTI